MNYTKLLLNIIFSVFGVSFCYAIYEGNPFLEYVKACRDQCIDRKEFAKRMLAACKKDHWDKSVVTEIAAKLADEICKEESNFGNVSIMTRRRPMNADAQIDKLRTEFILETLEAMRDYFTAQYYDSPTFLTKIERFEKEVEEFQCPSETL